MKKISTWLLLVLAAAAFWSCSDDSTTTSPVNNDLPIISFISPAAGDSVLKGGTMQIKVKMKAKKDLITKVKFLVDGFLNQELAGQISVTDTSRTFSWTAPTTVGTHTFKVIAQAPGDLEGSATAANIRVVDIPTAPTGMVFVNGGTFQMGSTTGDSNEQPVHSVTLSSFYIGKYEVTQTEWITTMETNPSYFTGDLNRPVESVSWYNIIVYCNKRSIAESLTPCYTINGSTNPTVWGIVPADSNNSTWDAAICNWSANGYRLPTEAEWEFAARGGNNSNGYTYSGSNTLGDVAWYYTNSGNTTHAVGTKAPNELGIYDMSGNVLEWNWDWAESYSATAQTNPNGVTIGTSRVLRGGSYDHYGINYRVAARGDCDQYADDGSLGFRLARSY